MVGMQRHLSLGKTYMQFNTFQWFRGRKTYITSIDAEKRIWRGTRPDGKTRCWKDVHVHPPFKAFLLNALQGFFLECTKLMKAKGWECHSCYNGCAANHPEARWLQALCVLLTSLWSGWVLVGVISPFLWCQLQGSPRAPRLGRCNLLSASPGGVPEFLPLHNLSTWSTHHQGVVTQSLSHVCLFMTPWPGVLQSLGSQRAGHDWVTELN